MSDKKFLPVLLLLFLCLNSIGQQMPFNPISYRIFSPFLLNPAIAGSKDFLSTDFIVGFNGGSHSQIVSGNSRIAKKGLNYYQSKSADSFTNVGIGASAFNDFNAGDSAHTAGGSIALAWHIPLNKESLTFLSFGASAKGLYHYRNRNLELDIPAKEYYFPNVDFGLYLYSPSFFTGLSVTNFLGAPKDTDTIINYRVPVSRQFNFTAGYKFVLSRSLNIVLEPSVMILTDDSLSFDLKKSIEP